MRSLFSKPLGEALIRQRERPFASPAPRCRARGEPNSSNAHNNYASGMLPEAFAGQGTPDPPPSATRRRSGTLSMRLLMQRSLLPSGEARPSLDFEIDLGSRHTDAVAGDIRHTLANQGPLPRMLNFAPCKGQITSWPAISPSAKDPASCVQVLSSAKKITIDVEQGNLCSLHIDQPSLAGLDLVRPRYSHKVTHGSYLSCASVQRSCDEHRQCHFCPLPVRMRWSAGVGGGILRCKALRACHASLRQVTFCFASSRPVLGERD
jgi:hypothetical protein